MHGSYRFRARPIIEGVVYTAESCHSHESSLICCLKIAYYKLKGVAEPDFRKKKCLQIIAQFVSKIAVFGHYLKIASLDFAKNFRNGRQ